MHNLPTELLLTIFELVLLWDGPDKTLNFVGRSSRTRIKTSHLLILSHVCRAWRDIVTESPAFWTRIDAHNHEKFKEFLSRAQSAPLSLFITSKHLPIYDICAEHHAQIRRLDMTVCPGAEDLRDLAFLDGRPLECFTLNYMDFSQMLHNSAPFLLFGEQSLPLKALAITPIAGCFPANHFPNLTHMHLGLDVFWEDDMRPTSSTLLDLLSHTPKLEFLTIYGLGVNVDGLSGDTGDRPPIHLDNLRSLVMATASYATVVQVLAYLVVPRDVFIRLHNLELRTNEGAPPFPHLRVAETIDRLNLATELECLQLVAEGPSSGLWLQSLIWDGAEDEDDNLNWSNWLSNLAGSLPLSQITSLELYVGDHQDILLSLIQHFRRLTNFSIRLPHEHEDGGPMSTLALSLYRALGQRQPLLCPNLQVVSIDVEACPTGVIPNMHPLELAKMLSLRWDAGHPIHRLVIQPYADEDAVEARFFDEFASQFQDCSFKVKTLELLVPGLPTIPFHQDRWSHWELDDADKYWDFKSEGPISYTLPWDY